VRLPLAWKLLAAGLTLGLAGGIGAYFVVLRSQPPALGLAAVTDRTPAPTTTPDSPLERACRRPAVPSGQSSGLSGLWVVQPGSVAGYRAHEKFADVPSPHVAVARTEQVSGWLLATGEGGIRAIETACVAVDLATLASVDQLPGFNTRDRDSNARDFLGVAAHPYAIFQPYPVRIDADISGGATVSVKLQGLLELHGFTRPATFDVNARLANGQVAVAGSTVVDVGDYGVEVPQEAAGFVVVDPRITLEISLVLART
jgi:hypothetical protein